MNARRRRKLERMAHHEAGHAVVGEHFGFEVVDITLEPPRCTIAEDFEEFTPEQIKGWCLMLRAGVAADCRYTGLSWGTCEYYAGRIDWEELNRMCQTYGIKAIGSHSEAIALVEKLWPQIKEVAESLLFNHPEY